MSTRPIPLPKAKAFEPDDRLTVRVCPSCRTVHDDRVGDTCGCFNCDYHPLVRVEYRLAEPRGQR